MNHTTFTVNLFLAIEEEVQNDVPGRPLQIAYPGVTHAIPLGTCPLEADVDPAAGLETAAAPVGTSHAQFLRVANVGTALPTNPDPVGHGAGVVVPNRTTLQAICSTDDVIALTEAGDTIDTPAPIILCLAPFWLIKATVKKLAILFLKDQSTMLVMETQQNTLTTKGHLNKIIEDNVLNYAEQMLLLSNI